MDAAARSARKPVVTILAPSLSTNSMGRTRVVAGLLEPDFDVEVFGFGSMANLWKPLIADGWRPSGDYWFAGFTRLRSVVRDLARRTRGDVILCIKPLPTSFGVGLLLARRTGRPLILDIDDWEIGFLSRSVIWEFRYLRSRWISRPMTPFYTRLLDSFTHRAAAVTVSNSFLQGLYGGAWIPHARAMSLFATASSGPPGRRVVSPRVVLFAGSAKGHKGMSTLAAAWPLVQRESTVLKVLGTMDEAAQRSFGSPADSNVVVQGVISYRDLIRELQSAAVVVVPQDNAPESVGQLPMKLLDAMAAGCPIVASDVGDISRWLKDGAGLCVPPGDPHALAEGIQLMLDDTVFAERCGRIAHDRVAAFGSTDVVGARLREVVTDVLNGRSRIYPAAFSPSTARSKEPAAAIVR